MVSWSLSHLADVTLSRGLATSFARESEPLATTLAHIAEFQARKLYLPAAYPNMHAYLLGEFHLSEDEAWKRIQAARAAHRFTAIYDMVSQSRLHLTAVVLLAPHLTDENAAELLEAAAHKTKAQIQLLLAERAPRADVPTVLRPVSSPVETPTVLQGEPTADATQSPELEAAAHAHSLVLEPVAPSTESNGSESPAPLPARPRVAPLSPGRYELHTTLDQATHDNLRRLQELLSHSVPSADIAEVLGRAFELAIQALEKRRFAATSRPRARRRSKSARHIPAHVRREVSDRDRYQCTFVSASGRRCTERRFLEYDHVHPVARGGEATVANTRLRCRAHNQYEAERTYGVGFMLEKRRAAGAREEAAGLLRGVAIERARIRDGAIPPARLGS